MKICAVEHENMLFLIHILYFSIYVVENEVEEQDHLESEGANDEIRRDRGWATAADELPSADEPQFGWQMIKFRRLKPEKNEEI